LTALLALREVEVESSVHRLSDDLGELALVSGLLHPVEGPLGVLEYVALPLFVRFGNLSAEPCFERGKVVGHGRGEAPDAHGGGG
jgi:hypothetical protein